MRSQPKENCMQSQPTVTVPWKVRECSIKNVIYVFSAPGYMGLLTKGMGKVILDRENSMCLAVLNRFSCV